MPSVDQLVAAALKVRNNAYAPYSQFKVGAALAVQGHDLPVVGCNVENASYGLAICAERMAIGTAVSQGLLLPAKSNNRVKVLLKVVVAATPLATPCGACRQFLSEFNLSAEVICVDPDDPQSRRSWLLNELLPQSFQF